MWVIDRQPEKHRQKNTNGDGAKAVARCHLGAAYQHIIVLQVYTAAASTMHFITFYMAKMPTFHHSWAGGANALKQVAYSGYIDLQKLATKLNFICPLLQLHRTNDAGKCCHASFFDKVTIEPIKTTTNVNSASFFSYKLFTTLNRCLVIYNKWKINATNVKPYSRKA